MTDLVLEMEAVGLARDSTPILTDIDWVVSRGEHWILIGPNGCGKSSLISIAGLRIHPSQGMVSVLGAELGRVDLRPLRPRIGTSSANLSDQLRPELESRDVVMCGLTGDLEPWWRSYSGADQQEAVEAMGRVGLAGYSHRQFGTLSSGERQRVLLARALVTNPDLLLLDEPNAGLDLGGREDLIDSLVEISTASMATVLVTHHVEDIPPTATHMLALAEGQVLSAGPIADTLSTPLLSELFGRPVHLSNHEGRWNARSAVRSSR